MTNKKNNNKEPKLKSRFPKWQKGAYDRFAPLDYPLPQDFLFICKLTEVTPAKVLNDFANNCGIGVYKSKEKEAVKQKLLEYFLAMGYGQGMYTPAAIATMFKEINAVHMLFPDNPKPKFLDKHVKWRSNYERYWFKKWYNKPRRRIKSNYYKYYS